MMKWALVPLVLLLTSGAHATMRCDQALIARGFLLYEVEERCGPPTASYSRVDVRYPQRLVYVDEWIYEQGSNRFRRVLHFENGRLRRIEMIRKPRQ